MRDRVSTTYLASIACLRVEAKQPHHAIATPRKSRRKDTATQAGARGGRRPRGRPPQARRHGPRRASSGHALGPVDSETRRRPHGSEQAKREIGRVRRRGPRRRGRRLVGRGAAAPSRGSLRANHAVCCDGVEVGASPKTKKSQRRREAGATSSPRTPSPRSSSTPARWRARSRRSRPRARRGTSCTCEREPTRTRTLATTTGRRAGSGRTRPSRLASPRSTRARRPDARRRRPGRGSPPRPSRSRSRKFPYFSSVHPISG